MFGTLSCMPTLYRQYRPQRFAEVRGQAHVTDTLMAGIVKGRISHAYLFQGPRGTGKTSTARILAKRLNCTAAKDAEPCGTCTSCVAIQAGKNIDVIEIDAASNRGIDNIRALRENTALSPGMSTYKVYIIDEVHMLSHDAFPALLKTLEEPVKHVVFILATTELHKVPPTILSRCQVYRFRRATNDEMRARLTYILKQEKRKADDGVIDFIISRADGCYRDAESLLGQLLSWQDKKLSADLLPSLLGLPQPTLVADFLSALVRGDLPPALQIIDTVYEGGIDPEQFLHECIRTSRDAVVRVATRDKDVPAYAKRLGAAAKLTSAIRVFVQAIQDLAYVPQPNIALQLAAMTITTGGTGRAPAVLSQPGSQPQPLITKQPAPKAAQAVAISTSVQQEPSGTLSLAAVKAAWPALITHMKKSNPVASTFLRAVEPTELQGTVLLLRVSYPLHRAFFEKPDHRKLVEDALHHLLGATISIRYQMNEPITSATSNTSAPLSTAKREEENEEIYRAVKEVFGAA